MDETATAQDRAYKPEDVAKIMQVTVYTVHDWLRSGQLSGVKLKSHWRVMKSDLDSFIAQRKQAAQASAQA